MGKEFETKDWFQKYVSGEYDVKDERVEKFLNHIWEYNDETFWFELVNKLAERDALKRMLLGEQKLDPDQYSVLVEEIKEEYREIIGESGLEHFRFIKYPDMN